MKREAGADAPRKSPSAPAADARPRRVTGAKRQGVETIDTDLLTLSDRRIHEPQRLAVSHDGMVATAHHCATAAGVEML